MLNMDILKLETLEADKALLEQYRKELAELERGEGLAKTMCPDEIYHAKKWLIEAIEGYRGYLFE